MTPSKAPAARAPKTHACAGCEARAEEIAFLRDRLRELEDVLVTGSPQGPAVLAREREQSGVKADPDLFIGEGGVAMVLVDGQPTPWTEYKRGEDALAAALAGKAVEIPASNGGV